MRKLVGLFAAAAFLVSVGAASADEGPNFTFGASTSYIYDINDPDDDSDGVNSFTYGGEQDEAFNIDLIQLGVSGERGDVSYGAKIDLGDLAAAAGDSADGDVALQEAYIGYDMDNVGFTAGRFGTPIGYEVLEPWGNAHISRSWGWNAQPINHDGLTVHGSADVVDVMVGVVNNFTVADPFGNDVDDEKGIVGSIGASLSDAVNLYLSGIYTENSDATDVQMINVIASGVLDAGGNDVSYAVEGNWREDDADAFAGGDELEFWSVPAYGGTNFGPTAVDVRFEYLDYEETDGGGGGAFDFGIDPLGRGTFQSDLWAVTLTAAWALVDGVDFRLEYRHDDADENVFTDDSSDDDAVDTIQAQLIWFPEL